MSDYEFRFGGVARLFGAGAAARLRAAHVCVIGIGGVGSWTVEALARSGVGRLTLVDLDEVCLSNINRQLPALDSEAGRAKAEVMAGRIRAINPDCQLEVKLEFFTDATAETLLAPRFDFVVDAIDHVANKCLLIARCRNLGVPVVTCGGAGGRRDSTAVRVADLAHTSHDRLLQKTRETLRREHGFPREGRKFGVPAVYSTEPPVFPDGSGGVCASRPAGGAGESLRLNCASGFGSAAFVTGAFGLAAAGYVVQQLAAER